MTSLEGRLHPRQRGMLSLGLDDVLLGRPASPPRLQPRHLAPDLGPEAGGGGSELHRPWLSHHTYDQFWLGLCQEGLSEVTDPVLAIGGWHDAHH